MAAGGHFGWLKKKSLSIAFLAVSDEYATFIFFHMSAAILDDRKSLSIAFLAISDQYTTFFSSQNGCRRPFWMTTNHFWSHFSPFQINTQLLLFKLFSYKMAAGGHFGWPKITFECISRHFRSILFFFEFIFQNGRRPPFWKSLLGHFGWPKITFDRISRHLRSIHNFFFLICAKNNRVLPLCVINGYAKYEVDRWICDTVRDATSFLSIFIQMAARGHFVFPIDDKNHRVLVIWDLNGYGEYEFDRCICDKVMACTSVGVRRRRRRRRRRRNQKHNITEIFKFLGYNNVRVWIEKRSAGAMHNIIGLCRGLLLRHGTIDHWVTVKGQGTVPQTTGSWVHLRPVSGTPVITLYLCPGDWFVNFLLN